MQTSSVADGASPRFDPLRIRRGSKTANNAQELQRLIQELEDGFTQRAGSKGQHPEVKLGALAHGAPGTAQLKTSEREQVRRQNTKSHNKELSLKDLRDLVVREKIGLVAAQLLKAMKKHNR